MVQKINYPFQVASIKQEKQGVKKTLGIDAQLSVPNPESEAEKSMPLEMHSGFSRFVATLIKKDSKAKSFIKANIPADEVPYIFEKTKIAMGLLASGKMTPAKESGEPLSLAYTERFAMGNLKGKTPAEVLLENPENKKILIEQGEYLKKNLEKFPANKQKIEAIRDAIHLLKEGKLEKKNAAVQPECVYVIYDEQMKTLKSMKDDDGRFMVYGIKIVCDTSRNLPFALEITNCYCPVDISENGKMNPRMKEAVNIQKNAINLTEKDWFKVVQRMQTTLDRFEILHARRQFEIAENAFFENRKNSRAAEKEDPAENSPVEEKDETEVE